MSESTTKTARLFLGVNGLFSCLVGLVLLLLNQAVAVVLFHEPATWGALTLRVLGVGLLVFSVYLAVLVVNRFVSKGAVMMIVYADMGWLIASAFVVLIDDRVLTDQGILIIDLTAIVVAICAIGQYVGARRIIPSKSRARVYLNHGVLVASVSREVAASSHVVWAVMTDHPAYADVANNLSKVDIVSGEGLGMVRRCFGLKGENWTETCSGYKTKTISAFGYIPRRTTILTRFKSSKAAGRLKTWVTGRSSLSISPQNPKVIGWPAPQSYWVQNCSLKTC